jgi:signal transduction histidine kinase
MSEASSPRNQLEQWVVVARRSAAGLFLGLSRFLRGFLILPDAVLVVLVILLAAWWWRHDARLRSSFQLEQFRKQSAAELSALQAQADKAIHEANLQHAQALRDLELRRQKLARVADELRERLASLQGQESARTEQVATLPTDQVMTRVATRLGLPSHQTVQGLNNPGAAGQGPEASKELPAESRVPRPESRAPSPSSLVLTDQGVRKVATALVQLDACQEQSAVKDQLLANCRDQAAANASAVAQLDQSAKALKEALRLKEEVLARREVEHQTELKMLRGTRSGRFARALQYIAAGVLIGVVVR